MFSKVSNSCFINKQYVVTEYETYDEFKIRVIDTLKHFSVTEIDNTIASMNKRIDMVIDKKGDRTNY